MNNVIKMSLVTVAIMSVGTLSVQAEDGLSIVDNVKVKVQVRPRYEMVDQSVATGTTKPSNAHALTNRLVIGAGADLFGTDWLSGYAEITDVHALNNNYSDGGLNRSTGIALVADAEQTRLTQSYLDFKYNKTLFRAGRQMVNLDNQRFVGAVGWRQMPQTFNAYALVDNTLENLNVTAAYVNQVNTIFEDGMTVAVPRTNSFTTRSVILNANYKVMDALSISAYGYMIGSVHDTYGIALTGKPKLSDGVTLDYRAEYATQTDASMDSRNGTSTDPFTALPTGKPNADADYYNLELGVNIKGILVGAGYEVLSGHNGTENRTAFSTPLATGHKFNGWADQFLATPSTGIEDMSLMVGYKSKSFGVAKAIYHDFSAESANAAGRTIDYGTELDLLYKRAIPGVKGLTGMLKYAGYNGDDSALIGNTKANDVSKFWVMLDYKFSN